MSAHTIAQKLSTLPFPLLPPEGEEETTLTYIAHSQQEFRAAAFTAQDLRPLGPEVITRTRRLLITAEGEGLNSQEFRELVVCEKLVHLHHGIYTEANTPDTPLLRALSCELLVPEGFTERLRFSRRTAAWILGFGQAPGGTLDLDYDRRNRVHLPASSRKLVASHQTTFIPYETLGLGKMRITNHLRTALDLLIYEEDPSAVDLVREILLSPDNGATPGLLLKTLEEASFSKWRGASLARAQRICAEVTLRQRGLW